MTKPRGARAAPTVVTACHRCARSSEIWLCELCQAAIIWGAAQEALAWRARVVARIEAFVRPEPVRALRRARDGDVSV